MRDVRPPDSSPILRRAILPRLALNLAVLAYAGTAAAQSAENVAVIVNEASAASQRIAGHYVQKRSIPPSNVIRIRTTVDEKIDRPAYVRTIERPVGEALRRLALQDRILYLVVTKGIPLGITGTEGRAGTTASVDSELTLLYRQLTGRPVALSGPEPNPYFLAGRPIREAQPFTHRAHDIFLVARLDGFTVEDALALIDRGQAPSSSGRIVLDQRSGLGDAIGDSWLAEAAARLRDLGHGARVMLEETGRAARDLDDVLGYYSWGSNDPQNRVRRVEMRFVPGAVAATFVSSDARTFQPPPEAWVPTGDTRDKRTWFGGSPQSLTGDLVREGATGVAGNVAEPYLDGAVRPDILFPAYLAGFNLIEAFYLALPHLSWQTVVVGDPLCRPFAGTVLTRSDIEDPTDPETGMPGVFGRHRLELLRAAMKDAPPKALSLALASESRAVLGDLAGARSALEEATALAPAQVALQLQLALLYEQAGDKARAAERYRQIIKAQPNNFVALNNLAHWLAVEQNAPDEAHPLARKAVALQPKNPSLLDTLGWIEHLLGNQQDAARLFTEALRIGTDNPEIHLNAARVFAAGGARAAAETHLKEALRLDPSLEKRESVKALRRKLAPR